jgi:hypothetical protein
MRTIFELSLIALLTYVGYLWILEVEQRTLSQQAYESCEELADKTWHVLSKRQQWKVKALADGLK